jgi:hypothetical protein
VRLNEIITRAISFLAKTPRTVVLPIRSQTVPSVLSYVAGRGDLLIALSNTPFGESRTVAAPAIVAALARLSLTPPQRFTLDPESTTVPQTRVCLCFHPARDLTPVECAAGVLRTIPETNNLTLLAVLTNRTDALAAVQGSVSQVASSRDPAFGRLVHQAIHELLSSR